MMKRKVKKTKKSRKADDAMIHEFETKDLSSLMKKNRHMGLWMKAGSKLLPTSLLLPKKTFLNLEKKASKRGVRIQTLLSEIVQDHLHEY